MKPVDKTSFTVGTFNVRGLMKTEKQKQFTRDIDTYIQSRRMLPPRTYKQSASIMGMDLL